MRRLTLGGVAVFMTMVICSSALFLTWCRGSIGRIEREFPYDFPPGFSSRNDSFDSFWHLFISKCGKLSVLHLLGLWTDRICVPPVWNNVLMTGWGEQNMHTQTQTPRLSDGGLNGRLAESEKPSTIQPASSIFSPRDQVYRRHFLSISVNAVTSCHRLTVPQSLFFLFGLQHRPVLYLNIHQHHLTV